MTLNRSARWFVVGSLALTLAGCGSGDNAGRPGQGSQPPAVSGTSNPTNATGSASGSQAGSPGSGTGSASASGTAADKPAAGSPIGTDGEVPGDNTVTQNPADFATPQTKMTITPGVDRNYQNGPTPEEIKKYNAISATPPKPVNAGAALPGNSGVPLFDNTGMTEAPK